MKRARMKLPILVLMTSFVVIGGCNKFNNSGTGVAGSYSGTITTQIWPQPPGNPIQMFGVVAKNGTGYFLTVPTAEDDVAIFTGLSGIGKVTSLEYDVPTEGQPILPSIPKWQFTITNISAATYRAQGEFMGVDTSQIVNLESFSSALQGDASVHTGTYQGPDVNRLTDVVVTLNATGELTGNDGLGCNISGTLSEEGNLDLYDVNLNIAGTSSCHGALSGAGFFDTKDWTGQFSGATGTYLYLLGSNGDFSHGFAMELKLE